MTHFSLTQEKMFLIVLKKTYFQYKFRQNLVTWNSTWAPDPKVFDTPEPTIASNRKCKNRISPLKLEMMKII